MASSKINVLFVDDEENNLESFMANFRRDFGVFTAKSAALGMEILHNNDIHVIVTDQKMPELSGVEFLEQAVSAFPNSARILLTAYKDTETAIHAINKGQVFHYAVKPFERQRLKETIMKAYDSCVVRKTEQEAAQLYSMLLDEGNDTLFIMDEKGFFINLNHNGRQLLKVPQGKERTLSLKNLIEDAFQFDKIIDETEQRGRSMDVSVNLINLYENAVPALISLFKIPGEKFYKGMIKDISRLKEVEKLLVRSVVESQETENIKLVTALQRDIYEEAVCIRLILDLLKRIENKQERELLIDRSKEVIKKMLDNLNSLCLDIMPHSFQWLGLISAVKSWCHHTMLPKVVDITVDEPAKKFPELEHNIQLSIFRLIKEFCLNAVKNHQANKLAIAFAHSPDEIYILLKANGNKQPSSSIVIRAAQARVIAFGGKISVESSETGTEYHIILPVMALERVKVN